MKKRIGILTGGGDVPPLNAVIRAARDEAWQAGVDLVGFLEGWKGVLDGNWIDLAGLSVDPRIGGTILKSSRVNIARAANGVPRALGSLAKAGVGGLIVVGGEDTLSNCFHLPSFPQALIAKTIDNDVGRIEGGEDGGEPVRVLNYFTLGYPTAAAKIVSYVSWDEGLRTTAYSHERIIFVEAMGMHAGWLALASGLGNPDFIVVPEFPVSYESLRERIAGRYREQRHVIVVVAEGARWADGSYLHAEKDEMEDFDHPRFGGSAEVLKARLKRDFEGRRDINTRNINAVNPSYLYRSGAPNDLDSRWAAALGKRAARMLAGGPGESRLMSVRKTGRGFAVAENPLTDFGGIADLHRKVDKRFYDAEACAITPAGRRYLKEIVGEKPAGLPGGIRGMCKSGYGAK